MMIFVVYVCQQCQQRLLLTVADNLRVPTEPACARCGRAMALERPPRRSTPPRPVVPTAP